MVDNGLFDEVRNLLKTVDINSQAMNGIGYKEVALYLNDKISKEEAIENIKKNTRHFAKRQFTWYKKMPYINWYDIDKFDEKELYKRILSDILKFEVNNERI